MLDKVAFMNAWPSITSSSESAWQYKTQVLLSGPELPSQSHAGIGIVR